MPKQKTRKAAAKRFKKTKSGKIKRGHAKTSHLADSKSPKKKRHLRKSDTVSKADKKKVKKMLES